MEKKAVIIGNSDGIGLEVTRRLVGDGWTAVGFSRSGSPVDNPSYKHYVVDVASEDFSRLLAEDVNVATPDLFIYSAGIGELLEPATMRQEVRVVEVNLLSMIRAASIVIPAMVKRGEGHFMGLSSLADEMLSAEAPSYHASKAGFSCYLESLALALKPFGVSVTNVRFGFVDTKMAKGDFKPFMMSIGDAAGHIEHCIGQKPVVYTAPRIAIPLVMFRKWMLRLAIRKT